MIRNYVIADVFTDVPLQGNQLAVFPDGSGIDGERMQRTARELNLSETVFVLDEDGEGSRIRIFTPTAELPFAGHPVLGTAFVLGEGRDDDTICLKTGAGPVPVKLSRRSGGIVHGEMEQPLPVIEPVDDEAILLEALGVGAARLPVEGYRNGPLHLCVALEDMDAVRTLSPDTGKLERLGAVGVSCFAWEGDQVKTRMFAPGLGVVEDPATGSAAGPIAIHLARHGAIDFGTRLRIRQGEEIARPSVLYAQADGNGETITRVVVGGSAVIVARGEYRLA